MKEVGKNCNKCKAFKLFEFFNNDKNTKDLLSCVCRECIREYNKDYRAKNKKKLKEKRDLKKDYLNEVSKAWYRKPGNAEHVAKYQKEYRKDKEKYFKAYVAEYYQKNKKALKEKRNTPELKAKAAARTRKWIEAKKKKDAGNDNY